MEAMAMVGEAEPQGLVRESRWRRWRLRERQSRRGRAAGFGEREPMAVMAMVGEPEPQGLVREEEPQKESMAAMAMVGEEEPQRESMAAMAMVGEEEPQGLVRETVRW
ncbi:hypothetical protein Syun_020416 [Stephania yunnanensis]|uniref:Uncharacterized protein n=1 Tax=Stephania yunnanensis TaxID=152371 RepID=A0AAP0NPM6_9MAGN